MVTSTYFKYVVYTVAILMLDNFDAAVSYLSPNRRPASDYAV